MTKYELNPRKIAFRALQIQDKVFDNGGISMYQFSFPEKERLSMIKEVEMEESKENPGEEENKKED